MTELKPRISVLMAVYNGEKYLKEAIDSVLNQTFADFEFIIVNDGSTDSSQKIIKSYSDPRIRLIDNEKNLGLMKSLNKGIKLANGEFIARMDGDDICFSERFEKQLKFLEKHPEIGVLGSQVVNIDQSGKELKISTKFIEPELIKWCSVFSCPLLHPTVMVRADLLKNNLYDESYNQAEDFELWSRLLDLTSFANLKEPWLYYRTHKQSATSVFGDDIKIKNTNTIIHNIQKYINLDECKKTILENYVKTGQMNFTGLFTLTKIYNEILFSFLKKEKLTPFTTDKIIKHQRLLKRILLRVFIRNCLMLNIFRKL
jgi:glycosyltransferase involved in cell wall biosynthesis